MVKLLQSSLCHIVNMCKKRKKDSNDAICLQFEQSVDVDDIVLPRTDASYSSIPHRKMITELSRIFKEVPNFLIITST